MRRPSDRPTKMTEAVRDASDRIEKVAQRQGRGTPAMRNSVGHVLELDPGRQSPYLTPKDVDSGLVFVDAGVRVVGDDGTPRDFSLRSLVCTDGVTAETMILTGNAIRCDLYDGALRWDPDGAMAIANRSGTEMRGLRASRVATPTIDTSNLLADVRARGANWSSAFQDGAITWSGDPTPGALMVRNYAGTSYKGVFCSALQEVGATSWSWSKTAHQPLADELGMTPGEVVDRAAAGVTGWEHDPAVVADIDDFGRRVGLMLDDLPEVLINRVIVPVMDETGRETGEVLDRSSWDVRGMVSTLLVELADLRRRVADLEAPAT